MVEAMFERSPNYFKQFQKQFKFLIVEAKPSFSIGNFYALCAYFDSEFFNLVNSHYHVLIDTTTFENETLKRYQSFPVPCVYTAFNFLFLTAPILETNGDVYSKLILAIEFNSSAEKIDAQPVPKRRPAFANNNNLSKSSSTKQTNVNTKQSAKMPVVAQKTMYNVRPPSKQTQTDFVNRENLRRVETILYGPLSGAFCQIMDIFMSGYGKVNIDSDLLIVRFVYEEKVKF